MKGYQRRVAGAYPYFKLAAWDARSFTWRAGKSAVASEEEARALATKPGRYRVERFDDGHSEVSEAFDA